MNSFSLPDCASGAEDCEVHQMTDVIYTWYSQVIFKFKSLLAATSTKVCVCLNPVQQRAVMGMEPRYYLQPFIYYYFLIFIFFYTNEEAQDGAVVLR